MSAAKKKTAKRTTIAQRSAARKTHKRSHHAPVTVDQKLNHILYMMSLSGHRERQALREAREQTTEVIEHTAILTAAIDHASHLLAMSGHEAPEIGTKGLVDYEIVEEKDVGSVESAFGASGVVVPHQE